MGAIATDARPAAASPIKSIQRGTISASSVTITHVDPAKSVLNLLSSAVAYASQTAYAKRVQTAAATGSSFNDRVISALSLGRLNVRLSLASNGDSVNLSETNYGAIGYEIVEYV